MPSWQTRKVVIVPLAAGLLGEEAAALLGSFVLSKLWQAIQRRVGIAEARSVTGSLLPR